MKNKILILMLGLVPLQTFGFDLEDYATTYRASRDAYLKAANELMLAQWPFEASYSFFKSFEKACYRKRGYNFPDTKGVVDGSCARDGELPHKNGGPALKSGDTKLGDKLALLINLIPPGKEIGLPAMEESDTNYRRFRDSNYKMINEDIYSRKNQGLYEIPNCVPQDVHLNRLIKDAFARAKLNEPDLSEDMLHIAVFDYIRVLAKQSGNKLLSAQFDIEDYHTTARATRDAYLKAANEVKLAIGPFEGAKRAYQAATTVYTTIDRCETSGFSRPGRKLKDPYTFP